MFLLRSDAHHDNSHCDQDLERKLSEIEAMSEEEAQRLLEEEKGSRKADST
jgi:hypothetical protein